MAKKIQVLGIDIDNHTVREAMFLLEEYVNTDGVSLAAVITSDILMQAADFPEIREIVDGMDLRLIGDISILEVFEETFEQQAGEIQRRDLEEVFLNSLARRKKKLFWISDSQADLPELETYIEKNYPGLELAGWYCGGVSEDVLESVINEINSVAPDVVLIQTADWARLKLLVQTKSQLNTKLCICMGYKVRSRFWSQNKNSKIKSMIDQAMFKRRAVRYEMDKENKKE